MVKVEKGLNNMSKKHIKEFHLYLDFETVVKEMDAGQIDSVCETYNDTVHSFCCTANGKVRSVIPQFLSFDYADRLFVHVKGDAHELTLGECEGTSKEIRMAHNLVKMLFTGVFDWFDPDELWKG